MLQVTLLPALEAQRYEGIMSTAENKPHFATASCSFMPEALVAGHSHRCAGSSTSNTGAPPVYEMFKDAVTDWTCAAMAPCSRSANCPDSSMSPLQLWRDIAQGHTNAAVPTAGHPVSTSRPANQGSACHASSQPLSWRQQLIRPLYPELRPTSAQNGPPTSEPDPSQTHVQAYKPASERIPAFRGGAAHQCSVSAEAAADGRTGAKLGRRRAWAAELHKGLQASDPFLPGKVAGPTSGASGTLSPRQKQPAMAVADAEGSQRAGPPGLARHAQRHAKPACSSKDEGSIQRLNGLNRPSRLSGQQKENCHPASQRSQPQAATQRRTAGSAQKLSSAAQGAPRAHCKEAPGQQHGTRGSPPRQHADTPRSTTHSMYSDLRRGIRGAHMPLKLAELAS